MDNSTLPADLREYLTACLHDLPPATRLVIVLDPGGRLALEQESAPTQDSSAETFDSWRVVSYDGNDLAFRRHFCPDGRVLVHITAGPRSPAQPVVDLSSLTDIFRRADAVLDLSPIGVLSQLIPSETWPAGPIDRYADLVMERLGLFLETYRVLRPHLGRNAALGTQTIRGMVLHCLQPGIAPQEFLFQQDTPARVLDQYVNLLWKVDWDDRGREMLREQAREASRLPLGDLSPWFEIPADDLAQFVYVYRFLSRAQVPNLVNQVRGLGILGFDPAPLEKGMSTVLALWARDSAWRKRVIQQAEASLQWSDLQRIASLLDLTSPIKIAEALASAETPALIYQLAAPLLKSARDKKQLSQALLTWFERRPAGLSTLGDDETPASRAAQAIASILDEAAFIVTRLSAPPCKATGLVDLLDWYVQGRYFDLEFAHARALSALNRLPDEDLRAIAQECLDGLRVELRTYLEEADHELARLIKGSWHDYITHSRLSARILWDTVKAARLKPTTDECLWFVVFDGMRYDTWERIAKPRLLQRFELKKEKPYLCALPSWTRIARTSLVAGRTPDLWHGYRGTFTSDPSALAGMLFDLTEKEAEKKLRFYSGMESDRAARNLDRKKRFPYNLLIFNISDDDLHKQRGHLETLNASVETALANILEFLDGLIKPEDTVVISSDHGFIELDPDQAIPIKDDSRWERFMQGGDNPVRYRYIIGVDPPTGLPPEHVHSFEYRQMKDGRFTVAVGRKWFLRQGAGQVDRYAHGGISLAEMVVPGAVLQLIAEKRIDLVFDELPKQIEVTEGAENRIAICVRNRGNQPGEMELTLAVNTDRTAQVVRTILAPGARYEASPLIKPVLQRGKALTESLRLALKYTTAEGKPKTIKREIPIHVQERSDVVEMSFGGLDDLDR